MGPLLSLLSFITIVSPPCFTAALKICEDGNRDDDDAPVEIDGCLFSQHINALNSGMNVRANCSTFSG